MNEVFECLCRHKVDIMQGWLPLSSTCIAKCTDLSIGKVKYRLQILKDEGLVVADSYGNSTEDGFPYCIRGYTITEKAKHTKAYRRAWFEERELCKATLGIDIGELKLDPVDAPVYLGTRPYGDSTVVLYRCSVCNDEFFVAGGAQLRCDHCGAEFDMKARELND